MKPDANLRRRTFLAGTFAALTALLAPWAAQAVSIVPACARISGEYGKPPDVPQLTCFLEMMANVALLILGAAGSFALLMFVYGGFMIVISAGESSRVEKGKTIIKNAVIGIVIIMTSGVILQYAISQLGISNAFKIVGQPCSTKTGSGTVVQNPDGSFGCQAKK